MKILITGGNGFIGRNLKRVLPQYKYEVLAPSRTELDMTDLPALLSYFSKNKVDAIIHTAFKGHFSADNNYGDFIDNIKMFDNLAYCDRNAIPTIIIGSGAEYDRRYSINIADESSIFKSWPIDLYGLSKNIISRRALDTDNDEIGNPFVIRLFGCFGTDEPEYRFIKRSILRLQQGLPIEINKNRNMDFFFVDDVARVIHEIISTNKDVYRNMNMVYYTPRHDLVSVANIICNTMNVNPDIKILSDKISFVYDKDHPYTGDGWKLENEDLNLIGLERGIAIMAEELSR